MSQTPRQSFDWQAEKFNSPKPWLACLWMNSRILICLHVQIKQSVQHFTARLIKYIRIENDEFPCHRYHEITQKSFRACRRKFQINLSLGVPKEWVGTRRKRIRKVLELYCKCWFGCCRRNFCTREREPLRQKCIVFGVVRGPLKQTFFEATPQKVIFSGNRRL